MNSDIEGSDVEDDVTDNEEEIDVAEWTNEK